MKSQDKGVSMYREELEKELVGNNKLDSKLVKTFAGFRDAMREATKGIEKREPKERYIYFSWNDERPDEELTYRELLIRYYDKAECVNVPNKARDIKGNGDYALWTNLCSKKLAQDLIPYNFRNRVYEYCKEDERITDKHLRVIQLRYDNGMTYRAIGDQVGLSTERIRQILARCDRILRGTLLHTRKLINFNLFKYVALKEMGVRK